MRELFEEQAAPLGSGGGPGGGPQQQHTVQQLESLLEWLQPHRAAAPDVRARFLAAAIRQNIDPRHRLGCMDPELRRSVEAVDAAAWGRLLGQEEDTPQQGREDAGVGSDDAAAAAGTAALPDPSA